MDGESYEVAYRASRLQYEVGRLATSAARAALLATFVAVVALVLFGRSAVIFSPVVFVVFALTEWRGRFVMAGARRGLVAGMASLLVPLSVLRPCCGVDAKAMGESCCIMPSACWATGAVVGLTVALLLPKAPDGKRLHAAVGLVLGMSSVLLLRCSILFFAEVIGLLGGIATSVAATTAARVWISDARRRLHPR